MMMRTLLVLALLLTVAAPPPLAAQSAPTDAAIEAQVRRLASEMRCPVCQGVSINESPTELATQMKEVIRSQLQEGRTPDEVKAFFVSRYGEWILLEPKAEGFNLLVYMLPVMGLVFGLGLLFVSIRRWTRPPPSSSDTFAPGAASSPGAR